MNGFLLIIIGALFSIDSFSQNQVNDSIELKFTKCLDDSLSTAGMCNCTIQAMNSWDKELNKNYNLLMKSLSQPNKEFLKSAQKEWILYRDKEFELINKIYYTELQGTMYYPMAWNSKLEIVKKRALELENYFELLKEK
jgi:uncharacterized protein YecT (DUF1311 family)